MKIHHDDGVLRLTFDRPDAHNSMHDAMASELAAGDWSEWRNGAFLNEVGESMGRWLECLDAL